MACGTQSLLAQACVSKDKAAFSQFWLLHGPDMGEVHGWWLLRKQLQLEHEVGRTNRHRHSLATVCLAVVEMGASHPGCVK